MIGDEHLLPLLDQRLVVGIRQETLIKAGCSGTGSEGSGVRRRCWGVPSCSSFEATLDLRCSSSSLGRRCLQLTRVNVAEGERTSFQEDLPDVTKYCQGLHGFLRRYLFPSLFPLFGMHADHGS